MATSGSSDFNRTRDQIIQRSGRILGVFKSGETMGSQEVTDFAEALNAMVKRWSATPGMQVWKTTEFTLFPQAETTQYALSNASSSAHWTGAYYSTTISADEASGQTTLSVTSTTNMTVSDNIGIVLDDGSLHWTTISSKTSSTVTIASALTDSAASGNYVFNYTSRLYRPLKIVDWRRYNISSGTETAGSKPMARLDYQALPNKSQTGTITQIFYDPQLTTGQLYVWNPPSAVADLIKGTCYLPIMDFDAAGDNPDMPQEWLDVLAWNLADEMAMEFDVPAERADRIAMRAKQYLDEVAGFDREAEAVVFEPDMMAS